MIDMVFTCHGSTWLMTPQTARGRAWIDAHVPLQNGGRTVGLDPRGIADFVEACADAGLTIDLR